MSTILFWTTLIVLPVMIGTALAWFRNLHYRDE